MQTGQTEAFRTYLFSYNYEGARWSFEIKARDPADAKARVARFMFASYDGELKASIPATPRSLWHALPGIVRRALSRP